VKIETNLQPNCSEIGLALNETSLTEAVKKMRKAGIIVQVDYDGTRYDNLPAPLIEVLVKTCRNFGEKTGIPTKVERFSKIKEVPEEFRKAWLELTPDKYGDWEKLSITVKGPGSAISLQIGDGCGGGDHICVETSDCEYDEFPTLRAVKDAVGGEVYGIDGGHEDSYNEWEGEQIMKEKK